jgi:outer membrane lipase/esterase
MCSFNVRLLVFLLFSLCAVALVPHAHGQINPPKTMQVFGDSLADNGNVAIQTQRMGTKPTIPPSGMYFAGRFSNGFVSVEYLWQMLSGNAPGSAQGLQPALRYTRVDTGRALNFAFGGAGTGLATKTPGKFLVPGLLGQVALYKAMRPTRSVAAAALYVIIAGSNDYLMAPINGTVTPNTSTNNIVMAIRGLHALGAHDFMVLNIADLGAVPLAVRQSRSAALTQVSLEHNRLLAEKLAALSRSLPVRIIPIDLALAAQYFQGMELETPAVEVLYPNVDPNVPPAGMCLFVNAPTCPSGAGYDAPSSAYFYWDAVHPTTVVHAGLAKFLLQQLQLAAPPSQ